MSDNFGKKKTTFNRKSGEQSTIKSEKSGNYLRAKHPELFEVSPLPGRYHRHLIQREPPETDTSQSIVDEDEEEEKSLNEEYDDLEDILESNFGCPGAPRPTSKDNTKDNAVRLCSIAISTIMMLAQKTYDSITMEHVRHTEEYFRALRQPEGYPANIGQLMQLLSNLKNSGKFMATAVEKNYGDEDDIDDQHAQTSNAETSMDNYDTNDSLDG